MSVADVDPSRECSWGVEDSPAEVGPRRGGFEPVREVEPAGPDCRVPVAVATLRRAESLVDGIRQDAYGHPRDDFGALALHWTAIFRRAGLIGREDLIPPRVVTLCMAALKVNREAFEHGADNCDDGAGYFAITAEVSE